MKVSDIKEVPNETKRLIEMNYVGDTDKTFYVCEDKSVYMVSNKMIMEAEGPDVIITAGDKITTWYDKDAVDDGAQALRGFAVNDEVLFYTPVPHTTYVNLEDVPEEPAKDDFTLKNFSKSEHAGEEVWNFDCEGCGFGCPADMVENLVPEPVPGDKVQTWGSWGQEIRGIAVNGKVLYYRTKAEQEVKHKEWVAEKNRSDMEKFLAEKDKTDARIKALPTEFQVRFEGYHKAGGDKWRAKFEQYELFCCEQAVAMVEHFRMLLATNDSHTSKDVATKIREWAKIKDWEEQKKQFPGLDDGHSGNTFGHMCVMACLLLEKPEFVDKYHAGMSAIVGSEEAHDWATRPENQAEIARMKAQEESKKEDPENLHEPK